MEKKRRFHIDERYVTVNLTLSIILYSMVIPFCAYLSVDNFIRGKTLVAGYALFCTVMTAIATVNLLICKFGIPVEPMVRAFYCSSSPFLSCSSFLTFHTGCISIWYSSLLCVST